MDPAVLTLCICCGQPHLPQENHTYNYQDEIDDDLICHICLQPLVQPLDTPCGHTYCTLCLTNFLLAKDFCPMDRKPLCLKVCKKSSFLVLKLLDKVWVFCPFKEHCTEVMPRCELEIHLRHRCKGAIQCGLLGERKRNSREDSSTNDADFDPRRAEEKNDLAKPLLPAQLSASAAVALKTDDSGLTNPDSVSSTEDSQSENNSSIQNKNSIKKHRPLDRTPMRSRSFKKLNRAFSYLRRSNSENLANREPEEKIQTETLPEEAFPRLHHLIPDGEVTTIKINRSDAHESLGITIVGGCETPVGNIVVQDIYRGGALAKDGRLLPGDMILEVNGTDISSVPHNYAVAVLKQPCQILLLNVLREQLYKRRSNVESNCCRDDSFHVILHKCEDQPLGIKLVSKPDEAGVFICNLLEGGQAAQDGQLQVNDRVLAINGHDLRRAFPEIAAHYIQVSEDRVHFVVSRKAREQTRDILQGSAWNSSSPVSPHERNIHNKNFLHAFTCHEKIISVRKEAHESLGMTVSGGLQSKGWDLPIYVTHVLADGCLGNDGRIKIGDILLDINGIELTGMTQSEAVSTIKHSAASSSVVFKALELRVAEKDNANSQLPLNVNQNSLPEDDWSPSWNMWLGLPRYLYWCKDIGLRRNTSGSLGFSIVGGYEENYGSQPFFVKSIVDGLPAYNDGRLRCGDMILAVNGRSTSGISHPCLVKMLKEARGKVMLTVASWPGSHL
ncbi:E3 ubiquitin-protein ligase LNX isoform X1 [Scyliorhinus canicula]|uniref:E3 ubiquitin-protein ligase LNX isoform X1 n=1 Tax=Scyliorhinus canicula TaxID=7830 RepID=UPI0018F5FD4E|nr:E3 ubiquitin-protein ligase LNX isoform X1 [Scyliorhinus canicula]XP_038647100.1 E3 ubiquitin-protein ligase LNX isoform X1 [Scyliorhinus canicula]XP_038647101.1 E3 ubiquitin-protein ligase LNX isoform X1 [Scyliorhinus canicula]